VPCNINLLILIPLTIISEMYEVQNCTFRYPIHPSFVPPPRLSHSSRQSTGALLLHTLKLYCLGRKKPSSQPYKTRDKCIFLYLTCSA
jgi:hypothetical protein